MNVGSSGPRVVVLGAAGEVGRWISMELAQCADIGSLLLLDVDETGLRELVATTTRDNGIAVG